MIIRYPRLLSCLFLVFGLRPLSRRLHLRDAIRSALPVTIVTTVTIITLVALVGLSFQQARAIIPSEISDDDRSAIMRAETFLEKLQQVEISFRQDNPDGSQQNGTIFLDRQQEKMRIEYRGDDDTLILIKDGKLEHIMRKQRRVQDYPLSATPARFLVAKQFSFRDQQINITNVRNIEGKTADGTILDVLEIVVRETEKDNLGELVMYFLKDNGYLVRWLARQPSGERILIDVLSISEKSYFRNDPIFTVSASWYAERD